MAYVLDRCRCAACRAANTDAERRRRRAAAYGLPTGLVDGDAARTHVAQLREQGLSVASIAELAGVGYGAVSALVYGRAGGQVHPDTEQRLLAVRFRAEQLPAGRRVDATGTRRRLQALATGGWSVRALAQHGEVLERTLRRALTAATVTAETARAVTVLYDELHRAAPPQATGREQAMAERTRRQARERGWLPPLAWTDIDADPAEDDDTGLAAAGPVLDEIAIERAMSGEPVRLTVDERREAVSRLSRRGLSARRIAELLRTTSRTVERLRGRSAAA